MKTIRLRITGHVPGYVKGASTTVPAREDGQPTDPAWRRRLKGNGCEVIKESAPKFSEVRDQPVFPLVTEPQPRKKATRKKSSRRKYAGDRSPNS
jgi:hypothetical protein